MFKSILKNKISFIIIIICLIFTTAYYVGASRYSLRYVRLVLNPIIRSANFTSTSLADFLSVYFNKRDLFQLNQELQNKVIDLSRKNIELETLRQENKFLKAELDFKDTYNYTTDGSSFTNLIARVIGRGPDYISTDLIIDQGLLAGIKPGFAVTTNQGVMIGKVTQVEDKISHIKLLSDNQSKVSAIVAAQNTALGLVTGEHNLNLTIELLPKDIKLNENDIVTTSGLDNYIPAGLLIGHIYQIDASQEKLWQQALVEPALDYHSVHLVDILIPHN